MKLENLSGHCYAFTGSVTIGYCMKEGEGLLIDSGLDDSSVKKVIRYLAKESLPLHYCVITHAHADHFGGAHYLKEKLGIPLFAPNLEKAIMENPILEPIYLFNGAYPLKELRNKFLEGQAVEMDEVILTGKNSIGPFSFEAIDLPGHSYGQVGLLIDDVLYAADSYFGRETLRKHIIPFIIDAEQTLESLEKLLHIGCKGAIPGHGRYEEGFIDTVRVNMNLHKEHLNSLLGLVQATPDGQSIEKITKRFLDVHNVSVSNLGQWLLYRTSVTAYLSSLERSGLLSFQVRENELIISHH
ncbi:MBL fold metallo-hydrolase [Rossellomorea aquimaris]|nr:MBL fold metallo-hydrolase [Rossellomorea aquimaris]